MPLIPSHAPSPFFLPPVHEHLSTTCSFRTPKLILRIEVQMILIDHELKTAAAAGVEALLVAILAVPAVAHFATKTRLFKARSGYESVSGFYEDGDGEATEESTQQYTDLPSRVAAWLSSSLGLAAAIAAAVLSQDAAPSSGAASSASRFFILWSDVIAWVSLAPRSSSVPG